MNIPKPQRIRLSRRAGFNLQDASRALNGLPAVNCARPGPLGNPFIVGQDGTRAECVDLFRKLCAGFLCLSKSWECLRRQNEFLQKGLSLIKAGHLRGKNAACHCPLDGKPCHCDVYLEIANP